MVTRTFHTRDGRVGASITVEGMPEHRIEVTINGEDAESAPGGRAAPAEAAPPLGDGRTAAATAVSVRVTASSSSAAGGGAGAAASRTAASVHVSGSSRTARHGGGPGGASARGPRGR